MTLFQAGKANCVTDLVGGGMETLAGVLQDEVHIHALGLVGSSLIRVRVARAVGSRPGNDPGLPACMNSDPENAIIMMVCTFTLWDHNMYSDFCVCGCSSCKNSYG